MNLSKLLFKIVSKIKPFLVKILPISFLRKMKNVAVNKNMKKIAVANPLPFDRNNNEDGINLIGNIKSETGLGQSCRLIASAIDNSDIPFTIYNYSEIASMRSKDETWSNKITNTTPYNINLIHINPYELALAYQQIDTSIWDTKYNIGFWLWELEEYPKEWLPALALLDEVWTPSKFAGLALSKETDKPIRTMPYVIEAPTDETIDRNFFNLPKNKFLYLVMYDSNSSMERKNPIGAIDAYKKAFPTEDENCGIVIKVNNLKQEDTNVINEALKNYKNVYIISEILTKVEVNTLISLVDVFISLHRAEGFGLVLAEAMKVGTPTIATDWSGNTEFMNSDVACMVDFDFLTLTKDIGQYKKGSKWADPNLDMAAEFILKLRDDEDFYNEISINAKKYIDEKLSLNSASKYISDRIYEILNF